MAYWPIYTFVRPQDSVRACENIVCCQVPSKSHRYDVPDVEFKMMATIRDPQRLLLVRPETIICRVLQIPSRPQRLPKASLWSVNRD